MIMIILRICHGNLTIVILSKYSYLKVEIGREDGVELYLFKNFLHPKKVKQTFLTTTNMAYSHTILGHIWKVWPITIKDHTSLCVGFDHIFQQHL